MSVDSVLDSAFVTLLEKARTRFPEQAVRPAVMKFGFSGEGVPVAVANVGPRELDVPFPCRIVWARLKAGDDAGNPVSVTATVDVQLSTFTSFGAGTPLYGTGAVPALAGASKSDLSLTGWQINLDTADTITARLTAYSGTATWVTLSIQLRPTDVPLGVAGIVDGAADTIVDGSGNVVVRRT